MLSVPSASTYRATTSTAAVVPSASATTTKRENVVAVVASSVSVASHVSTTDCRPVTLHSPTAVQRTSGDSAAYASRNRWPENASAVSRGVVMAGGRQRPPRHRGSPPPPPVPPTKAASSQ